ncbi:MAG: HAMP domain-containing protein, partial [Betaproteobacteria bacterium]|nr:HAMP domain-containing protein [Betaproteobacteria bacterium]
MREIADELVQGAERAAQAAVMQSVQEAQGAIRTFAILGLIALLAGAGMVSLLNRIIASPLKEISGVAERVAAGDLTVNVPPGDRADEVGALVQAFRKMVENLRQVTHEMREGANVLASSAGEIVATTTQVASGAAETA